MLFEMRRVFPRNTSLPPVPLPGRLTGGTRPRQRLPTQNLALLGRKITLTKWEESFC